MANIFKTGKMMSDVVDSALTNGIGSTPIMDGAIVTIGGLSVDTAYVDQCEYDVYKMEAPTLATDEVAIVDYAGIQEGSVGGNQYRIGTKLYNLAVPAGTITRLRRPYLHDKFWLGEDNFNTRPVVGNYATVNEKSFTHKVSDTLPANGYAVKVLAEEDLTVGMRSDGSIYLVEVVQIGGVKGKDLLNGTPSQQIAYLFEELHDKNSVSDYISANTDSIMDAAGISKDDAPSDIATILYDKLQAGDKISATMGDGANLTLSGHFSDEKGNWRLQMDYILPEIESSSAFPVGSKYTAKGGTVRIVMDPAEVTSYGSYGGCIIVYAYSIDVSGATISNGVKTYTLDITGLKRPEDPDHPFDHCLIIDPNRTDWTITTHEFRLPEADAEGTIKVDGKPASWKEIRSMIS